MQKLGPLVLVSALVAAAPALAHHSAAMFDQNKLVLLKGTVLSYSYINPHVWISIEGAPQGQGPALRWDVEATAPQSLARIGIAADTLKPGDKVSIAIRPLRDGRRGGSLVLVVTPDGKSHGVQPSEVGLSPEEIKPS